MHPSYTLISCEQTNVAAAQYFLPDSTFALLLFFLSDTIQNKPHNVSYYMLHICAIVNTSQLDGREKKLSTSTFIW